MNYPDIKTVVSFCQADRVAISPQGTMIAFTRKKANKRANVFDNPCFISFSGSGKNQQITGSGKIKQLAWMNESHLLLLVDKEKSRSNFQVVLYSMGAGGQLTQVTNNIPNIFRFYLFSTGCIIHIREQGISYSDELYYLSFQKNNLPLSLQNCLKIPLPGNTGKITNIAVSQDLQKCVVSTTNTMGRIIYLISLNSGNVNIQMLPNLNVIDCEVVAIAPNNKHFLVSGRLQKGCYIQHELWVYSFTGEKHCLTQSLDRDPFVIGWCKFGILIYYADQLKGELAWINPENNSIVTLLPKHLSCRKDLSLAKTGDLVFVGQGGSCYPEVYFYNFCNNSFLQITRDGEQVSSYSLGNCQAISWQSRDGLIIHGILRTPEGFDLKQPSPLVIVAHGGPCDFAELQLFSRYSDFSPYLQLLEKGFLVLEPNYRGSVGRGQYFMAANVNMLGRGDLWDIESSVDALHHLGMVDVSRVACIGWSQGGYISAFAATHSSYFSAVCIGAGISDWATYHSGTNTPDFTQSYFPGYPNEAPNIYRLSSVIAEKPVKRTPMLICHGRQDLRVPPSCSYQLSQYCHDNKIPSSCFMISDMGHHVTTPKQNMFVLRENFDWLCRFMI